MPRRGENIRKRSDGRWEGRYKVSSNIQGETKYLSIYGKTYNEVKNKLRDISKLDTNATVNPKDTTLSDILKLWKKANHIKHKGATEAKYEYMINKHILPTIGNVKISSINTIMLNQFAEQKIKYGRLDGSGGLSSSYVRSMMIIINSTLKYAVNEGICMPLKGSIYKPTIEKPQLKVLSDKEYHKLENYLTSDTDLTKLGILLSLNCGLRIGEICALKWEDIDVANRIIYVKNTISRVQNINNNGTLLVVDTPKTKASVRDIPIHSKLMPIIDKAKAIRTSEYVISETSKFLSPRTYEYRYHCVLNNCGIAQYNYHTLRHTFATRCILAGVDVKTLSEILGHANVSITLNTYVHPSMQMKIAQIEKLDAV